MTNTKDLIFAKIANLRQSILDIAKDKPIDLLFLSSNESREVFTPDERQKLYDVLNNFRDDINRDKLISIQAKEEYYPEWVSITLSELITQAQQIALEGKEYSFHEIVKNLT